jgi:hypothetical protein
MPWPFLESQREIKALTLSPWIQIVVRHRMRCRSGETLFQASERLRDEKESPCALFWPPSYPGLSRVEVFVARAIHDCDGWGHSIISTGRPDGGIVSYCSGCGDVLSTFAPELGPVD